MGVLGRRALHLGEQVGVERELQHVLRVRPALELRVRHLVGPGPERRGPLDPFEKVAPSAPAPSRQGTLEDDVCRPLEGDAGCGHALRERDAVARDLDDRPTLCPQPRKMASLVGVAVTLEEGGVGAVLGRGGSATVEPGKVERRGGGGPPAPHQVGGGETDTPLVTLHRSALPDAPPPRGPARPRPGDSPAAPLSVMVVTVPVIVYRG
jgi:hypothetical protein